MKRGISTRLMRTGENPPSSISQTKTVPIYMSSSYSFDDVKSLEQVYNDEKEGYIYSRMGNPGHDVLKSIMKEIEEGEDAEVFSSGMAAINMSILANVEPGDHIVACNVLYGGTYKFLKQEMKNYDVEVSFVDFDNESINKYFKENTKLVYMESISNPLMEVYDIKSIGEICKKNNIKLCIDNTFSPIVCKPLELGADIVVYSATKYLCGHSDIIGGIAVGDKESIQKAREKGCIYGTTMSPFDAWILARSLRTLELRVTKHSNNALKLAEFLQNHKNVKRVYYPGLRNSKSYNVATYTFKQGLYGGMLSVDLKGGEDSACKLIDEIKNIKFVPSLAGVATSLSFPARTSHRDLNDEELEKINISKGLLRISTGLEDIDDVIEEFDRVLNKIV